MTRRAAYCVVAALASALPPARGADPVPATAAPFWVEAPAARSAHSEPVAAPPRHASSSNPLAERLGLTPTFEVRGRIEADAVVVAQSRASQAQIGDVQNGYGFRRARLGAQGHIGTSARWVAEIDFANGNFRPRDVYVGLTALPGVSELNVGYFREPFSLEGATSSRFITFLERSPLNQLDPARDWGVAGYWWPDSERLLFALGAFRDGTGSDGFSGGDRPNWAVTTRLTGLPVYEDGDGAFRLVHVGGALSARNPLDGVVRYAPDPQSNIIDVSDSPASPFLPPINVPANSQQLYNLQAAAVLGPLSVQGEWFGTAIQQKSAGVVFLQGFYVYGSYFLTGEHRGYDRLAGGFSRVNVLRPVVRAAGAPATGIGAVELAARFSVADFVSGNLPPPAVNGPQTTAPTGAIFYETTLGLNWYLNDYTRIMANYTLAVPDRRGFPTLPVHVFGVRTAIYW